MRYWTWEEIKEKIENDMDLQEEPDILSDGELMGYVNDAIDVCEQYFIKLGDYFLATDTIDVVAGTRDYDLPSDIYATKIRKILNSSTYEVKPLKDLKHANLYASATNSDYCYIILNQSGATPKIRLFPTPTTNETLDIFYTRNANRLTSAGGDDQEVDIPEAMGFIMTYIKMRIYEKEKSPLYQMYYAEIEKQEKLLEDALSQRIDDENNLIEPDVSEYEGMYV